MGVAVGNVGMNPDELRPSNSIQIFCAVYVPFTRNGQAKLLDGHQLLGLALEEELEQREAASSM